MIDYIHVAALNMALCFSEGVVPLCMSLIPNSRMNLPESGLCIENHSADQTIYFQLHYSVVGNWKVLLPPGLEPCGQPIS